VLRGAPLKPRVALLGAEGASARLRAGAAERIQTWLNREIENVLHPLLALNEAHGLYGAARGLAFRMLEVGGALDRADADDLVCALDSDGRAALSKLGVWIGRRTIFAPRMLKPRAARLWSILCAASRGEAAFIAAPGAVSAPLPRAHSWPILAPAGFRAAGPVAVRLDVVERLANALRAKDRPGTAAYLARLIGRPERELADALAGLGYRKTEEGGWTMRRSSRPRRAAKTGNAFAALAELAPPVRRQRSAS
jgi:ATP-dependent RNA helicase SUPV3L1/SUV3